MRLTIRNKLLAVVAAAACALLVLLIVSSLVATGVDERTAMRSRLAVCLGCLVVVIALSITISRGILRSLRELEAERTREDWLKAGHAGLSRELRGELEPAEAASRGLDYLARYLGAPAGALYYLDADGTLRPCARHALAGEPPSFRPGEGVLGQAALQTDIVLVRDVRDEHLRVRSALAETRPGALVLAPLVHGGKVTGVLELGLMGADAARAEELLGTVRETLTIAIEVARGRAALAHRAAERESQRRALEEKNLALLDARRHLEQKADELTRASEFKSQFLASMSHELRTPLNSVIGFAQLLAEGVISRESPEHQEFLEDILTSARHLLGLINDILDLSKVEAGKMEFRPELTDVDDLVEEVTAVVRTAAASKRIAVERQIAPELGEVTLDATRLKQVIYNFVSNAIKFTPEGGTVTVRAHAETDDSFRVEVEDTGIGIAPEDLPYLFQEFRQLDQGGAQRHTGTGLGLALTRRLVEAQRGRVGVQSARGKGSVFFAILPRHAAPSPGVALLRSAPAADPRARSVLVIEDDGTDGRQLLDALSRAGYAVEVATTAAQALTLARSRVFDAITLDLVLPDMSGPELLRLIRTDSLNQDVPIVVITIIAEPGGVAGFAVNDILPKPVGDSAVLGALRRAGVPPDGPGTVLVVDDDPACLKVMATTLRQLGYRARCESDGASGLRAAHDVAPSAIVLDLCMPGMDGFEFLDRLRSDPGGEKVPVIVWTVKDLSADEQAVLRASAQAVVSKGHGGSAAVVSELDSFVAR